MEFLLIWFLFGICAAIVASNRGANGCLWFGIGVLLGPIGFALAFTTGTKCPQCASRISEDAKACPHCGQGLGTLHGVTVVNSKLYYGATADLPKYRCSECKVAAEPGAEFCRNCGVRFRSKKLPEAGQALGESDAASEPTKRCPFCAEKILAEARKCRYCGEFLQPQASP